MTDNREEQEILAWTNFINLHAPKDKNMTKYLPIKTNNQHLIDLTSKSDGFFLRDFIYWCSGNNNQLLDQYFENLLPITQNTNAAKFLRNINYNCCLEASKSLGITLINITCSHLISGNVKYTLSLIWQLIALRQKALITQFNVIRERVAQQITQQNTRTDSTQSTAKLPYNDVKLEKILIQWVNEHQSTQIKNMGQSFVDGKVLFELAYNLSYNFNLSENITTNIEIEEMKSKSADDLINTAFQLISGLGVEMFLTPEDIKSGNPQYMTILISEMLIRCLELEMTQNKDNVNELESISLQDIFSSKKLPLLGECDYRSHCQFDQYRSHSQITIDDTITSIYHSLHRIITDHSINIFLSHEYQYVNNLNNDEKITTLQTLIRTLRNILDDLISKFEQKSGNEAQKIEDSIHEIMRILMVVSVEKNIRMHVRGIDFKNSIQKLLNKNVSINTLLPATYYLHEIRLLKDERENDEIASSILYDFPSKLKVINEIDEQAAYCYIYFQVNENVDNQMYDNVFKYITMVKQQNYDDQMKYNALCFLLNTVTHMERSRLTFEQVQNVYESSLSVATKVKDPRLHSLFCQILAEFLQDIGKLYPQEVLQYISKSDIITSAINQINTYQSSIDINKQVMLLSNSIIIKAGRQQLNAINNNDETSNAVLNQYSKIQKNIHQIYKTIVQDHIGNVIVRRAARNILFAITNINEEVSNTFISTLTTASQIQSQAAFSESLKDLLLCFDYVKDKDELLIKIFDIVLAHANRHYKNVVVAIETIEFFCSYAKLQIFYTSQAYEQLDSIVEIRLEDKKLAQLYLQMLNDVVTVCPCVQLFDTCINSVVKILNLHQTEASVMIQLFKLAKNFASQKQLNKIFMDELSFFGVILEALNFFYQNRDVVMAITEVVLELAENSATCCKQAEQQGVFKFLRQWGKQWKKDTEMINIILKTHAYALYYLGKDEINSINVVSDLCQLM